MTGMIFQGGSDSEKPHGGSYVVDRKHDVQKVAATPETVESIAHCLERHRYNEVRKIFETLHYADQAFVLESLKSDDCDALMHVVRDTFEAHMLVALIHPLRLRIVKMLGCEVVGKKLEFTTPEDAVDFLSSFSRSDQIALLKNTNLEQRQLIRSVRSHPENSAGSIMDRHYSVVSADSTILQALSDFRESVVDDSVRIYDVFATDHNNRIIGIVEVTSLLRGNPEALVSSIMKTNFISVHTTDTSRDVVHAFNKYDLNTVLVLSTKEEVVGTISIDTVKYIADEQVEEDILKMRGSSSDLDESLFSTTKVRFIWLLVNLITTSLAATVISGFENEIHQNPVIAVWIPIGVSMGSNAGTQAVTVIIRALATKKINRNTFRLYFNREILVSLFNAVSFALICAVAAFYLHGSSMLAYVFGITIGIAIFISVLAGIVTPLIMKACGTDPAITSGVFLTTITEVSTFAVLLFLARALLM